MKILHYIPTYAPAWSWGGPVVSTSRLCAGLSALGHQVTVFTTNAGLDSSFAGKTLIRDGVTVVYAPRTSGLGIQSRGLETLVQNEISKFDVLHVTGVWQPTSCAACSAAKKHRVPYVVSPRGALGEYSWRQKRTKKLLYFWLRERRNLLGATGVHFTSALEARESRRFFPHQQSVIIPNGVIDHDAAPLASGERAAWRARRNLPTTTKVLLYAGRLHHKKGLELLPPALAPLFHADWTLLFIGNDDDGTGKTLERSFATAGLGDKVRFLPGISQAELRFAYAAADLLLFPSLHENFGNVLIESLHGGCPALTSTEVGAAEDAAASGGVLRLPREPALWTDHLLGFFEGRWPAVSREHLAAWTAERYTDTVVAQAMGRFYSNVVSAHARTP